jgi:hypothetical protein
MKHTPEEIKNRLSNIGEAIGDIALDYITDLEKENTKLQRACHKWFMRWREAKKDALYFDSSLQKQIEATLKLQQENAELKADNDARKFAMAMSEKVEKQLREENAELKEKVNILDNCDRLGDVITEAYKDQLTKAKQFIRDFLSVAVDYIDPIDKNYSLIAEAEQFLKEE